MRRCLFGLIALVVAALPAHADLVINSYALTSGATRLLGGEVEGFAIDATQEGGYVTVRDTGTPANDLSNVGLNSLASPLVQASASPKSVRWNDGTLRWAPHNYALQSQTLSTSPWSIVGGNITSVTADATVAPDGTTTAELFTENNTAAATHHTYDLAVAGTAANRVYTVSAYFKAGTRDKTVFKFGLTNHWVAAVFDLSNCTVGETAVGATSGTIIDAGTVDVGGGWCRGWITGYVGSAPFDFTIGGAGAASGNSFTTIGDPTYDGASLTWSVWGAQISEGNVLLDYVPTTSTALGGIPQGYDGTRFGILVEPAATNLQIQSQTFDNAAWGKSRVTVSADAVTAPDGTTSAETLTEDSTATNTHQIWDQVTLAGGTVATWSVYAKAGTRSYFALAYGGQTGHWVGQIYDLSGNGALGESTTGGTSGTLVDSTITAIGNGWYRLTLTASITNANPWIGLSAAPALTGNTFNAAGNITWSGNGTGTVHIWGMQAETGTVATSYIPTVASTVTRAVDDITVNTATIPFQQNPGTMYADFSLRIVTGSGSDFVASFSDGTDTNDLIYMIVDTANPYAGMTTSAANQAEWDLGTAVADTRHQLAFAWNTDDVDGSFDGAAASSDAAATMSAVLDELQLGNEPVLSAPINGFIHRFVYVPRQVETGAGNLETWRYNF
jgi:hypothetical protein